MELNHTLFDLLTEFPDIRQLWVGYSGGVDSHALLHALAKEPALHQPISLRAVHVDHGLQTASKTWAEHCQQQCQALAIPLTVLSVDASPRRGESPEAAARRARYDAMATMLNPNTAVLTGQHQDDQAETLLLQLLRGAGPAGLAAMPAAGRLGQGRLWRPLLRLSRAEILQYALHHRLCWIEDDSNQDRRFDRNYLRHEIMPLLQQRWPAAQHTLARAADLCADANKLNDALAAQDLAATSAAECLRLAELLQLSQPRQRNLIRYWLKHCGLPTPNRVHLEQLLQQLSAASDRQIVLRWPGGELRRYRQRLYALPTLPVPAHDPSQQWAWSGEKILTLPTIGSVWLESAPGQGLRAEALVDLSIRFRHGGERFHPLGRGHSQTLKKLLQEAAIPPWQRDRLPLLYCGAELIAVADVFIATAYAAAPGETGWVLRWRKPAW